MTTRLCTTVAVTLLLLSTGCATLPDRAEIPLGHWSGTGVFAWHGHTDSPSGEAPQEIFASATYKTELTIEPLPDAADGAVQIEILSLRGKVENVDGDRTHLIAHLEPAAALPDGTVSLYRLTALGISDKQRPYPSSPPSEPSHASCELRDGELLLRIHYFTGFTDKLRFRGNEAYKTGVFSSDDAKGAVHWFERLHRER